MKLAHYGTFDVDNYGDLLFPKIIEWRLPDWEVQHVSPTAKRTRFKDAAAAKTQPEGKIRAYVTGGGNIFNFRKTNLEEYSDVSRDAYAKLVIDPAQTALRYGATYLINSPSISFTNHTPLERFLLAQTLKNSDYIAFRDSFSVSEAQLLTDNPVYYVPDTALDVARMWPAEKFEKEENYITVHLNRRYGGTVSDIVGALDRMAEQTGLHIVLLPIGPCHGDIEYMREVSGLLKTHHRCHEDYSLHGFAETIARGQMYLGSSMHGFITALSYGRPCLLVLGPEVKQKFIGLLDLCGLPESAIVKTWEEAADKNCPTVCMTEDRRANIFAQLDAHWERFSITLDRVSLKKWPSMVPLMPLVYLSQTEMRLRAKMRLRTRLRELSRR